MRPARNIPDDARRLAVLDEPRIAGPATGSRRTGPSRTPQRPRPDQPGRTGGRAAEPARGSAPARPSRRTRPAPAVPPAGRRGAKPASRAAASAAGGRRAVSDRGRRLRRNRAVVVNSTVRHRGALGVLLILLVAALVKLTWIQGIHGAAYAADGAELRDMTVHVPAIRGSITDRDGTMLAFSIEGRAIAARPALITDDPPLTATDKPLKATGALRQVLTAQQKRERIADILVSVLGTSVNRQDLLTKLGQTGKKYVYLVRGVLPAQSDAVMTQILDQWDAEGVSDKARDAVAAERQDIRQTPEGTVGRNLVGSTGWDQVGLSGIESMFNATLTGTSGIRTEQVDSRNRAIPNTVADVTPTVDGVGITLTVDTDLQYTVEHMLADQVTKSQAKQGCAVVKGVTDGQIYAMSCYKPDTTALELGNPAVSNPFEPGSVNKVVTFAAALDRGLISPKTHFVVPDNIYMGGHVVHDAWGHEPTKFTATGILAKSSNVGTLMIARKLGPEVFAAELAKFGLGAKTGIQLPGESAGQVPPRSQWSATTFANMPIGQGVSMSLLQLVDMYQAIGNKGVLLSPTIIAGTTADGGYHPNPAPKATAVMKPTTASTLLGMLRATVQNHDGNRGTGWQAAVSGYQVAGKTGTAQQVDPKTGAYSDTDYNATFAGIVPADHPKFAIAIMLDAPQSGSEGGASAAPLFRTIAAYALRADDVPPSAQPAPLYDMYFD